MTRFGWMVLAIAPLAAPAFAETTTNVLTANVLTANVLTANVLTANVLTANALTNNALINNAFAANGIGADAATPAQAGAGSVVELLGLEMPDGTAR